MTEQLIALAIAETPDIIKALKALFAKQNPSLPEPTSEQVIAAYESAFQSSLAKDTRWLSQHPTDA